MMNDFSGPHSDERGAEEAGRPFVEIRGLTKTYLGAGGGLSIIRDLDLSMGAGEILVITGESGSGKTTLLNILGGLDRADGGEIRVVDTLVSDLAEFQLSEYRQQHLGFIFQFHHLLKDFSALENAMMPALILGKPRAEAQELARELLDRMGMAERLDHFPYQLSGGERQRVAIARALVNDPGLILADEPTGSLDEERSREVEALLFDLVRERGKTMIIVTHDRRLAGLGMRNLTLTSGSLK
jgi:lipoprotein-releasing system ATP-binding protein